MRFTALAILRKFIFIALALSTLQFVVAQEPMTEPLPAPYPSEEELQRMQAADAAWWQAEEDTFSYSDVRSVYLVPPELPDVDVYANANTVAEEFSAQIAHSWRDVDAFLEEAPIDILFIHNSALDQADREWVHSAYRNNTLIVGISTPFEALADIAGDSCAKNPNPQVPEFYKEWVVVLSYTAAATPTDGKAIVDTDTLDNCSEEYAGLKGAVISHNANLLPIYEPIGLDYIVSFLRTDLIGRKREGYMLPSQSALSELPEGFRK